ncbi:MAG: hypothetical protein HZB42_07125 [Sphingobacteriales bacterium]|nr:hypothetical protein [Sphingobacteriales bacterium]
MCFSATASFGAGAILGVVGIIAVAKAKTKPQRVFATIPLIFAVQQLTEGILWLSLKNAELLSWQPLLTYIYLVFAMAVWPLWVPLTIRLLEKDKKRKRIMNALVAIGAAVSIIVTLVLSIYPVEVMTPLCLTCPVSPTPGIRNHLHYEFTFPAAAKSLIGMFTVLYIMATIVTPFISGIKKMKWLGVVFLVSYLFAVIFYNNFVVSVWCFFAALLSFVVLWIILELRKTA